MKDYGEIQDMRFTSKEIIKDTQALLRDTSLDVSIPLSKEDQNTLFDLLTYVRYSVDPELSEKYDLRPAVGIAATQVGILKKLLAIVLYDDNDDITEYALANAKIISHSQQKAYLKGGEACLSVDGLHEGYVPRAARITVEGYDLIQGKEIRIRAKGYEAIVIQHEIDHFFGTLYYDHINKENPFMEIKDAIVIE